MPTWINYSYVYICLFLVLLAAVLITPSRCLALRPNEVLLVANGNVPEGVSLSRYYMAKRRIPETNLIILDVVAKEIISREAYEEDVAAPIRHYLNNQNPFRFIRCLLTMYGLPLKVAAKPNAKRKDRLKALREKRTRLKEQVGNFEKKEPAKCKALREELAEVKQEINKIGQRDQRASLDSEIALVLESNYPLESWIPNRHFAGYTERQQKQFRKNILMVSRLDGPSSDTVRRVIDDSLIAEESGLRGKAYFDARWSQFKREDKWGPRFYDKSIQIAADLVKKSGIMPVVLETEQGLFQQGDCPEAALYCGWYSLANYVDAFDWQPGSVGYHIASSECSTLKENKSRVWCKMLLQDGVAATLGPVSEPYVESFPVPALFFGSLLEGTLTLSECYAASNPFWSWKMVLIGDPLYRPFKHRIK